MVARGAAILGAAATRPDSQLTDVARLFQCQSSIVQPNLDFKSFHDRKFDRFCRLGDFLADFFWFYDFLLQKCAQKLIFSGAFQCDITCMQ